MVRFSTCNYCPTDCHRHRWPHDKRQSRFSWSFALPKRSRCCPPPKAPPRGVSEWSQLNVWSTTEVRDEWISIWLGSNNTACSYQKITKIDRRAAAMVTQVQHAAWLVDVCTYGQYTHNKTSVVVTDRKNDTVICTQRGVGVLFHLLSSGNGLETGRLLQPGSKAMIFSITV